MKGFTLIELIIVIVIIGILAAIAIPKFLDLRDEAQKAARDGTLGAARAAVSLYYAGTAVTTDGASFPDAISGDLFADNQMPTFNFGGYTWAYSGGGVFAFGN